MAHSYCRHRFTTLKRWQSGDHWYVIQHCRWCDKWQRKTIEISDTAMSQTPKLINEVYRINDVGIKKVEEVSENERESLLHQESKRHAHSPPQTELNT